MQIQPIFQTVGQLLGGRLFKVPHYQRAYSWGRKQRDDLFRDILKVYESGPDASHFMATVVGLRKRKVSIAADDFIELDIVDGQQRLTTLVLVLKAIAIALGKGDAKAQKLGDEVQNLLVKGDDLRLLLLQTNHDSTHIFSDYVRDGAYATGKSIEIVADQNLVHGITESEAFVSKWIGGNRPLIDLVSLIRNRLSLIFHEIEDEALVYTVFEVLNSRGLDVTWFDKLKSLLMAIIFEHGDKGSRATTIAELHNLWRDIYQTVGLRQSMNRETLRFAGTLKSQKQPNRPLDEETAVGELVAECEKSAKKTVASTKWILRVVKAEDKLLSDHRLRAVTDIVQARLVAVAILLREFPTATEMEILRRWENVTFRIYGLSGNDARTAVGDYVRLAWRIHNASLTSKQILESLAELGKTAPIKEAVKHLWKADCYSGWKEELRYFLFRYEEALAKSMGHQLNNSQWNKIWQDEPSKSIEHIKAQRSKVAYMHRLGNLTALPPGVNSALQDNDPKIKAKTYGSCGLLDAVEIGKTVSRAKWGLAAVERREKKLIKWAMTEWDD